MGYTGTHKPSGMTIKAFFEQEFNFCKPNSDMKTDGKSVKVLDCATVNRTTAYLAVEIIKPIEGRRVIAVVCLIRYSRDYYNFTYKDMDEGMGPFYYDCPERILNLLTRTDSESALKWRAQCRENLAKNKNRITLHVGYILHFEKPIKFTNGQELSYFRVESIRPMKFKAVDWNEDFQKWLGSYGYYKIPRRIINEGKIVTSMAMASAA